MSPSGNDWAEASAPEQAGEYQVFRYEADNPKSGARMWVNGRSDPVEEFEFTLTNLRAIARSDETGEVAVPLPLVGSVGSSLDESMTETSQGYLKWVSLSLIAGILAYAGYTWTTGSAVWAVLSGVGLLYLWLRIGGWIENVFTHEYRWLAFSVDQTAPVGEMRVTGTSTDPDSPDADLLVRLPAREFSAGKMENIDGYDPGALLEEDEPYALPNALFERIGFTVHTPDRVSLKSGPSFDGEGGPTGAGYYVCENCGTKLDATVDINTAGSAYTCGDCGYELDEQQRAITQRGFADEAWDEAIDGW